MIRYIDGQNRMAIWIDMMDKNELPENTSVIVAYPRCVLL